MHPQPQQESIVGHFLLGGLDLEVSKKVVSFFGKKKCTPAQTKSGYAYAWRRLQI